MSLRVFAAELRGGRGGCRQESGLSTCDAALLAARPLGSQRPLAPATGPLSSGFLISSSPGFCLHSPPLRAAYKHHVPVFIWNYSTVKCTLLANSDTGECGNPHSFVYSTKVLSNCFLPRLRFSEAVPPQGGTGKARDCFHNERSPSGN